MADEKTYSAARIVILSNEWMRRFIDEPEQFRRQWQTVIEFLQEEADGKVPSYGEHCAGYLSFLDAELRYRASVGA